MILDTNALSALIDGDLAIGTVIVDFESLKLNSVSLGEDCFGILQSRHLTEYENQLSTRLPYPQFHQFHRYD